MKRLAILILSLLLIFCVAFAEQEEFKPEGEWYATMLYRNNCLSADRTDEGFAVNLREGGALFRLNGVMEYPNETVEAKCVCLSDDAVLFWDIQEHCLFGVIFIVMNGEWKYCSIDDSRLLLFIGNSIIPYESGDTAQYLVSGNNMYLTQGESYVRGTIRQFGNSAFAYDMDVEPRIVTYGDTTVDYGTPMYLFISSSVGQ